MGAINEFPPELLSRIFLNLPYKSLLSLQAVCVRWKAICADPALSIQLFKKPSKVYVEPGLPERYIGHYDPKSEPVRSHPAIQEATYTVGDDISEIPIFLYDEGGVPLAEMAIANDFVSIPAVTMVAINQDDPEMPTHYNFKVQNKDGVRLIDLFKGMEKAANRRIPNTLDYFGYYGKGKTATSSQLLGDYVRYDGLDSISRKGLRLSAGSFPTA